MKFAAATAAILLALAPMSDALAGSVSKSEVAKILTDKGFNVRDFDSTKLLVDVGGYQIVVFIVGDDADISFRVYPGVHETEVSFQFLNRFNNEVKFGRAYIDDDGDVAIQMDRNSAGGVSAENIESDFDVFLLLINKFLNDLESQAIA